MSRLNIIPFRSATAPRGPAGTKFSAFTSKRSNDAQMSALQGKRGGSKKGHAGSVAGLRGGKPRAAGVATPKGPSRIFSSVKLPNRATTRATTQPAVRRSLLNRVVSRARSAFGA